MVKNLLAAVLLIILLILSIIPENPLYQVNPALLSTSVIAIAIVVQFMGFEKGIGSSRQIAIIASLSALAAASRVALAGIAGLQPATFIIMLSGYVFGAQTGFLIGAVNALVSNFFLGQGPWTPWQMAAWGLCGMIGAALGRNRDSFLFMPFVIIYALSDYLFGWFMNIWHWIAFVYPLNIVTFLATYGAGLIFDTLHAAGNAVFALLFGPSFYTILRRYKKFI